VIKGALIFGVGFGLGYAKAMSDQEAVRDAAREFKLFLQDLALAEDVKKREAADAAAETRPQYDDPRAEEAAAREEERQAEEVDDADVVDESDEEPQGETS
jgi:hypothetical protein